MLNTNLYLLRDKKDQNGECPIYLFINQPGGIRKRVSTRYKCSPSKWNEKKQRLKGTNSHLTTINAELEKILLRIAELGLDLYRNGRDLELEDVRRAIKHNTWEKTISPIVFFEEEIEGMKHVNRESTIKAYKTTFKYLLSYKQKRSLSWTTFNESFDSEYSTFLKSQGNIQSDVTIGKHIKTIKALLNKAYNKGLINNQLFRKYKVFKADSIIPSLETDEINHLWNSLNQLNEKDKSVLLIFLFLCETSLRIGEATALRWEDIEGDFLQIYELKNDKFKRPFLTPKAKYILKYFKKRGSHVPLPIKTTFNRRLKSIAELLGLDRNVNTSLRKNLKTEIHQKPLYQVMCSKIGRRTYITMALKDNIPLSIIQRNTGHSDLQVLGSYNKLTDNMIIDYMKQSR